MKKNELLKMEDLMPNDLLIMPIVSKPVFPNVLIPLTFSGEGYLANLKAIQEKENNFFGVALVKELNEEDIFNSQCYNVGTIVKLHKVNVISPNTVQVIVQGLSRFEKKKIISKTPELRWNVNYIKESEEKTKELQAYILAIMNSLKEIFKVNPIFQEELKLLMSQSPYDRPDVLVDLIASMLKTDGKSLQELLETFNLEKRCFKLLSLLKKEIEIAHLQEDIQKQIEDKVSKQQKEYFLREQMKVIKKELGLEKDDKETEIEKINERIAEIELSEEARRVVEEQLEKLQLIDKSSPEFHVTRSYISSILELPWGIYSEDILDVKKARKELDREHYGLEDVKDNILEFIGTIIKTGNVTGSILCLAGPPGVGKTSIGRSIATTLGREFYRFSVGGMRDEAEIKGHRRTYIGAMPGKIIQALKTLGTSNPVIMLDEIDKIGSSYNGDPASALLEVLDPEQNKEFLDHYLDVRYDLSNVLFITTANQLDTIPRPLLDRMEIINLSGYILEEKLEIAKRYLIPKQMSEHGLAKSEIKITTPALKEIIDKYAREAGVRNLEKQIRKIMRKTTLALAEGRVNSDNITLKNLKDFLGMPKFETEKLYKKSLPGVTLGLAWTSLGGATLYIEANNIASKGPGLKQTGQLGNVMKESSEIAYSYVRSIIGNDKKYPQKVREFFDKNIIHIHVPAGATPKDGPSAGVTMALALYSLATNKPVKQGIAMTGELTLTGKVLPIGGIREKVIAARRVGIYELIVPKANKNNFEELPDYLKEGIKVNYADYFKDVLNVAFDK